jgi:protein-disulfide isomerase
MAALLLSRPAAKPNREPFAPVNLAVDIEGAASLGSGEATLVLLVFSDFQCPYCQLFAKDTLPKVISTYVAPGDLRLVFMNFPLVSIHPLAMNAAVAVTCANRYGQFWRMHDALFLADAPLGPATVTETASRLGLSDFSRCMAGAESSARVRSEIQIATGLGVHGTPTIFLGTTTGSSDQATLRARAIGPRPFEQISEALQKLRSREGQH